MANLYLMCGVPGSGKSTFLNNRIQNSDGFNVVVSRDKIRFSIVRPDEEYFSHEDEVMKLFWDEINKNLSLGKNVFVDQTSLTKKSRKWLLNHINGYHKAYLIWIDATLEECLKRNEMRKGTRAYVPREQIRRMFYSFEIPSKEEGFSCIFKYTTNIKGELINK